MFDQLKQQLTETAAEFTEDAQSLATLLTTMANDVERVMSERLVICPVAHHSPASALHMVRRLQERPPKVIYIELCEDMVEIVANLRHCKLPVALQAFAAQSDSISEELLPVTVVAPLTEASAEYQAIAYCLEHPETALVFVDRAVDYIFQWQEAKAPQEEKTDETTPEEAGLHGTAVGVNVGALEPTFEAFVEFLLRNSSTRHFSEWWDQYVERTIIPADGDTYRQVMVLVGSLIRNLGRKPDDVAVDELRERYMWTRIKQHLWQNGIAPEDALYICGAAHTASHVPEFGTHTEAIWQALPPQSNTQWLFGVIPSSFAAIEYQFSHPAGTVSLAESTWQKSMKATGLTPFSLSGKSKPIKALPATGRLARSEALFNFLTQPPTFASADHEQLLDWSTRIVVLARNNGYLASTADSIAIYETAMLLANLRNRSHPSPYDFVDSAITCLEKDRTPKKRNIAQLCRVMLGGDRIGSIQYEALPPLAQNIYDRLAPLRVDLFARTNQRALLDFNQQPHLRDCSELLWRLNYLVGDEVVLPIMGERKLGSTSIQESWEVRIGKHQAAVIQLGYEGVTLEQVLEQRMKQRAYDDKATAALALYTAEVSLLYLNSPRLTRELGLHACRLLEQESSVANAPDIFHRARRLVHYYRTTPAGLPDWLEDFVAAGYTHYASLLPQALTDNATTAEDIAGMLGFIFTLEGLALSLGCSRSQIVISVQQVTPDEVPPEKRGLLWVAEWLLNMRNIASLRSELHQTLENPLLLSALPAYLNGLILSLTFAPRIGLFVVELLSLIFANLPDSVLMPWLPGLILQLRKHQSLLQPLIREAAGVFPAQLSGFDGWQPRWLMDEVESISATQPVVNPQFQVIRQLLFDAPESANSLAALLGVESREWHAAQTANSTQTDSTIAEIRSLLEAAPGTMDALAKRR
jgi:hypothetical protein